MKKKRKRKKNKGVPTSIVKTFEALEAGKKEKKDKPAPEVKAERAPATKRAPLVTRDKRFQTTRYSGKIIEFLKYKNAGYTVSVIAIILSFVSIFFHHGLNYGIDFTGGTQIKFKFLNEVTIDDVSKIRKSLKEKKLTAEVQVMGNEKRELIVRTSEISAPTPWNEKFDALKKKLKEFTSVDQLDEIIKGNVPDDQLDKIKSIFYAADNEMEREITRYKKLINLNFISGDDFKKIMNQVMPSEISMKVSDIVSKAILQPPPQDRTNINEFRRGDALTDDLTLRLSQKFAGDFINNRAERGQYKTFEEIASIKPMDRYIKPEFWKENFSLSPSAAKPYVNSIKQDKLSPLFYKIIYPQLLEKCQLLVNYRESTEFGGLFKSFDDLLIKEDFTEEFIAILNEVYYPGQMLVQSTETVGPSIGRDLRKNAFWLIFWTNIAIIIYIWFRFKHIQFSIGAVIPLVHDTLITLGILSITNTEINIPIIAAILTIIGYSLNDTIVEFDRVRENNTLLRGMPRRDIINISITQTLSRTIITSVTTLLAVIILFVLGGSVIHGLAFTLIIGVIVGTYSSIFVACPILNDWPDKKRR